MKYSKTQNTLALEAESNSDHKALEVLKDVLGCYGVSNAAHDLVGVHKFAAYLFEDRTLSAVEPSDIAVTMFTEASQEKIAEAKRVAKEAAPVA
ncbi:MAG: hypothetical protein LAO78_23815 [Acidobacteriia bacterium]|nr:hypothetical protein [Terriglobia bacterium]